MTSKHATLTPSHGKPLQTTVELKSGEATIRDKNDERRAISRTIQMHNLHFFSYAWAAAETVNLELASIATQDDVPPGGGVLPYMGYIGMCGPIGYGFSAVLVINRVSIFAILPPLWS